MVITAIKQQVRRRDRYSLYVDGKYGFSLSEGALLELKLATGQELDSAQLEHYRQLSSDDKLFGMALRYVALRRRSRWEIDQYLLRKQASPEAAEGILSRLADLNFIDDEAFAKSWIENRHVLKPTSQRRLRQELKTKHVADYIINSVLENDDIGDQEEIEKLIIRKRRQTKYQDDMKLAQYLVRQGFSYDKVKLALSTINSDD